MEKENLVSLILSLQQGEDQAATDLYNAFHKELYYYIYKTVNDSSLAEDLLQETFIEIFQTINNLNDPSSFVSWSRQIAYHRCTAYFRKRREILADEDEDGYSIFDSVQEDRTEFIPDEALDKEDLKQTIHAMIATLPPEQRSALLLRYFDELSVKEIADIQGVSEGTVKSRLNYGRKAIQKSVEDYEKKSGIKLHCVGIIPLLLWLFREYATANSISRGAGNATAAYAANSAHLTAEGTSVVAASGASSTGISSGTTTVVSTSVKTAGKFAIKKLIAGIAAVAVVAGGVATGALLTNKSEEPDPEPQPMQWCNYGEVAGYDNHWFDLRVEQMDDDSICGYLTVSQAYEPIHETYFEGEGTLSDESVLYTIDFETSYVTPYATYSQMELAYYIEADQFVFDEWYVYEAVLDRVSTEPSTLLAQNERWQGIGETDYVYGFDDERLFVLDIDELREDKISGKFTILHDDQIEYESTFTGRGYIDEGTVKYEILYDNPRHIGIINYDDKVTWLYYDLEEETFSSPRPYSFTIEKLIA